MFESRADRSALGAAPDMVVATLARILMSKNLVAELENPTSKETLGPSTFSASDFTQEETCFDLLKETRFAFAT